MNMNAMNFLLGKAVARDAGEERSTQLGLLAGLMPGFQGVLLSAVIARREAAPAPAPTPATDPKIAAEALKRFLDALNPPSPTGK